MKYCPRCGGEYFDTVAACGDCNETLINENEWEQRVAQRNTEDQEVFVKVTIADDQFEADVIRDALEKEAIPVLVRSFSDTSFDGIFIPQKGWGSILVPEEFRRKANDIIEAIQKKPDDTGNDTGDTD